MSEQRAGVQRAEMSAAAFAASKASVEQLGDRAGAAKPDGLPDTPADLLKMPGDLEQWLLFWQQSLSHIEGLFHDALCLTGHPAAAASICSLFLSKTNGYRWRIGNCFFAQLIPR